MTESQELSSLQLAPPIITLQLYTRDKKEQDYILEKLLIHYT
jgi:hypothetical protein